jgi:hypothetical protein
MSKRGMSTLVASLILVTLCLVALVFVGITIKNSFKDDSNQLEVDQFTLDLEISQVQILNETDVEVTLKRNSKENELSGAAFVFYDEDDNEISRQNVSIKELEDKNFSVVLKVVNSTLIEKISIAPIFKKRFGKDVLGEIQDKKPISYGGGGSGGSSSSGGTSTTESSNSETGTENREALQEPFVLETCWDEILNNEETGVDCGGPNCLPCADPNEIHYLVQDGVALADIVVSDTSPNTVILASRYFQNFIEDMTGVVLQIRNFPGQDYDFHIYVGESSYTDSLGVNSEGCRDHGFKIVSGEDYLILLGDDEPFNEIRLTDEEWDAITGHNWKNEYSQQRAYVDGLEIFDSDGRGSINAVYEFMHGQGMRWYYPTKVGKIVPQKKDIYFNDINKVVNPDFGIRDLFLYYQELRYLSERNYPDSYLEREEWVLNLRINNVEIYPLAHGINAVSHRRDTETGNYIIPNPEYFAVLSPQTVNNQPDNIRDLLIANENRSLPGIVPYPNQDLCNENLKLDNIEFVKAMVDNFGVKMVSVAPGDGFTTVPYDNQECLDKVSEERPYDGRLSNYVWNYVNDVAWEVYEEYGDEVKILNAAYTTYRLPPDKIDDPRGMAPNIVVSIARSRVQLTDPEQKEYYTNLVNDWIEILPSKQVKMADYYLQNWIGSDTQSVPFYHPHLISEDLQFLKGKSLGAFIEVFANTYVEGGLYDAEWDSFAAAALNVYVISRLWWDSSQDVDELLDEYYYLYYGPAREEMKALVEYSEERAYYSTTDPKIILNMRNLVSKALQVAQADSDPIYEERVKLVYDLIYSDYVGEEMNINSCQDLNIQNMIYYLDNDVSSEGTCFDIDADGVTLDCQGHTITYSTGGGSGDNAIYNNEFFTYRGDYFNISNCVIQDGSYLTGNETGVAISLSNADFGIIQNVIINTSGVGIYSGSSVYNKYLNNEIHSYSGNAFSGTINPNREIGYWNIFEDNYFKSVKANGMKLYYLDNVTIRNNIFESEETRAFSTYLVTNITSEGNTYIDKYN